MKTLPAVAIALAVGLLPLMAEDKPQAAHKPDEAVAHVNNQTLTWGELDKAVAALKKQFTAYGRNVTDEQVPLLRYDVLQQMVTHELVLQEARGHEPANLDEQVKQQLDTAKTQLGGDEAFNKALADMDVTLADYAKRAKEDLIVRERIRQIAEAQTKVTPEDVKNFYDSNRDKMKLPERVRASHILIQASPDSTEEFKKNKRAQIESVQTLLKGGEKFADMARKFSEDKISARNGGELGVFTRGQMAPEFEAIAFSLKTNEVSDIFTTKFGYHLVLVTEHLPASDRTLDDAKADIEKYLRYTKGQEVTAEHIKKLRDAAKIEVLLPKPEAAAAPAPAVSALPAKPLPTVETKPVAAPTR
jgi:parvulin-like peptidyl-prolyl isomerase